MTEVANSRLHAVVVGIDVYGSALYRDLQGAAADARAIDDFLRVSWSVPDAQRRLLVADRVTSARSAGDDWPSYANIAAALRAAAARARPEDHLLFFFGGHGATTPTLIPEERGADGRDRALVPADAGAPDGPSRLLHDIELAKLIDELAKAGLQLSVVLDCCHSGGSMRAAPRSGMVRGGIDDHRTPLASLVGSPDELVEVSQRLARTRPGEIGSGWRLPARAVVAAACQAHEFAYEEIVDQRICGLFCYWWLEGLKNLGLGSSYREHHRRVLAQVRTHTEGAQNPVLEGDANREIFGEKQRAGKTGILVFHSDPLTSKVVVGAGRVHGLGPEAKLEVHLGGGGTTILRVVQVETAQAEAFPIDGSRPLPQPGDLSRLIDPGLARWRAGVDLDPGLPTESLQALNAAIESSAFLEMGTAVEFRVRAGGRQFEIRDGEGALLVDAGEGVEGVTQWLDRLTRYRNLRDLANLEPGPRLTGLVQLRLLRPPPAWKENRRIDPKQGEELKSGVVVRHGETLWLEVDNRSNFAVSYAVFELRSDWSCVRLVPNLQDTRELLGRRSDVFPLKVSHRRGPRPCRDHLKLLACLGATQFDWLELPAIVRGEQAVATRSGASDPNWTTDNFEFEVEPIASE